MAGQKSRAARPKAKTRSINKLDKPSDTEARALESAAALMGKDPALSRHAALRRAGITEVRELRRLAGKLAVPARKTKAETPRSKPTARPRAQAAAPLLARSPVKVGAADTSEGAVKPPARGRYLPQTDVPPHHAAAHPPAQLDILAMARPWMTLGWRMTAAGIALQARMAKAAMAMPPATTAMRQGTEAFNAWLSMLQAHSSKKNKD